MVKLTVEQKYDNKKLISYISLKYPKLSQNALQKALRNKDIKINGKRVKENILINAGDEIEVYISDDILNSKVTNYKAKNSLIVYEDENILIYNKPQEIDVQGVKGELGLQEALKEQMRLKYLEACHRIDRNTRGLVIFAKNEQSRQDLVDMINDRQIEKYYKALVYGIPKNKSMTEKAYLFKDSKNSNVIISDEKKRGYVEIITKYKILESDKETNTSTLEIDLITGRTHQIRAHLAYLGYPIIGDGKYGINKINKAFKKKYQELEAYKLVFKNTSAYLKYLKGKTFEI